MVNDATSTPPVFQLVLERFVALTSRFHAAWSVLERLTIMESEAGSKGEMLHRDFQSSETAAAITGKEWV
ncbi:hypothetical protein PHYSODRAFT_444377, partial [Phytophthora sojae]